MTRKVVVAAVLIAGAWLGQARAGKRTSSPVTIISASRYAYGSLGSTRNATGITAFIGCWTDGSSAGATGQCWAQAETGPEVACMTNNSSMLAAMRTVTPDSQIQFVWDTSFNCTYVFVDNSSYTEPKQP